jgi:hypothetical protein
VNAVKNNQSLAVTEDVNRVDEISGENVLVVLGVALRSVQDLGGRERKTLA